MKCIFCSSVFFFFFYLLISPLLLTELWHGAVFKSSAEFQHASFSVESGVTAAAVHGHMTRTGPPDFRVAVLISKTHNRHRTNTDNKTNKWSRLLIHVVSIYKIVSWSLRIWLSCKNSCMNDLGMKFETAAHGVCLSLIAVGRAAVDLVDLSY